MCQGPGSADAGCDQLTMGRVGPRVTSMGTEIIVETEEEKEKVTFMETDEIFRHNISFNGEKNKKLSHSGLSVKDGLYWNCD